MSCQVLTYISLPYHPYQILELPQNVNHTFSQYIMPGGDNKVTRTQTNLQLSAAGLFKYV